MIRSWKIPTDRLILRVQPDGIHADLLGTGDINLHAVPDKQGFRRIKPHPIQRNLKDFATRLPPTYLGRDQDLLKQVSDPLAFQNLVDRGGMVKIGDEAEPIALMTFLQYLPMAFRKLHDLSDLIGVC